MRVIWKSLVGSLLVVLLSWETGVWAQSRPEFTTLTPSGPRIFVGALVPHLQKWYLPQELYYEYGWKGWEYSNYARERYERYTDILLEGTRYYDIVGNYVTKGWKVFDYTLTQPALLGSDIRKDHTYQDWFDNLLISSTSKGQWYSALTIGDVIRTTLTPLTFMTPSFNGIQLDFLSDKYQLTALTSRISLPALAIPANVSGGSSLTNFTNFIGLRGTVQLGDFATMGATYVNASHWTSENSLSNSSLKGALSGAQNAGNIETIIIRLSDDSPEDGKGGAVLYSESVFIDGQRADITPRIEGGVVMEGFLEASGDQTITLTYDIRRGYQGEYQLIKEIEFALVLANDYRVEVTSNLQTDAEGVPVFLTVTRAEGNIRDNSNQTFVHFQYGLPTANDIYGVTLEIKDFRGLNLQAEYNINRRFRRFPNQNYLYPKDQHLSMDKSTAFFLTASQTILPWFMYGEVFSIDPFYSTSFYIQDQRGFVNYKNLTDYRFEFVDDNDDQDRFPDWKRNIWNQRSRPSGYDVAIFPGLDENNDLIWDFNQNDNLEPDYAEPFLRYQVDPPEFYFGMDMNNNGTIDRFENDNVADYPYKADHRGYNVYTGLRIIPGLRFAVGYLDEHLISSDQRSASTYGVLTWEADYARLGRLQLLENIKRVRDDIRDDLYQWTQPPFSTGAFQDVRDPLIARNALVNATYLQFDYTGIRGLNLTNKLKYEGYFQRGSEGKGKQNQKFFGLVNKADYTIQIGEKLTIWPKWKSMYRFMRPTDPNALKIKELTEIGFLMTKFPILRSAWITAGVEYTLFNNFVEPAAPPPGFLRDYKGTVLVAQFTNTSDYLGYGFTSNIGFRWERKAFEEREADINSVAFIEVYAGIRD